MRAELERYNLAYSMTRLTETARTFRKLGETYEDMQSEGGALPAITEQLYVMANTEGTGLPTRSFHPPVRYNTLV